MSIRLNTANVNFKFRKINENKAESTQNDKFTINAENASKNKLITASVTAYIDMYDKPVVVNNGEKFWDVKKELDENVPDRTTTIEEKELAIQYIDRMLACDDIPDDAKRFWTYNKEIIKAEIQNIKNEQLIGSGEKFDNVLNELNNFADNYRNNAPKEFLSVQDRVLYWQTYNNTCISYYERMLSANDVSDEQKEYCKRQIMYHKRDINYGLTDLNNYNKENNIKTESFNDVFRELKNNVPDRTSTLAEKDLAISYIDRMLACDDIPDNLKLYWANKKDIIEKEILNIQK